MSKPQFVDVHSHVSFPEYDIDRGAVIDRMRDSDTLTITVGVDLESSKQAIATAQAAAEVRATIGLHPADNKEEAFKVSDYEALADNPEVVGIGECGLDYFRIEESDTQEKERQKLEFTRQVEFAVEKNLPLMLHVRPQKGTMDAYEDVLEILEFYKNRAGDTLRGNVHFYVGNLEIAKRFVELDFTLSFTAVLTFARDYDEVVKEVPLDMILSETDSPYVAPPPHRGERNEPIHVRAVVKKIAEIRGQDIEIVAPALVDNAYRVFGLD